MKDTKVAALLRTFTAEEFKDLGKFVASPFHRNRDLDDLFKILKTFYPDFEGKKFTNAYVYEKLYPDRKFGDAKSDSLLKTLTSELFILCKEFLIQLELKENESFKKYLLLTQLRKRKLTSEFLKESETALKRFDIPGGEVKDFLEKYFITNPLTEFYIDINDFSKCYEMIILQGEYITAASLTKSLRFTDQKIAAEDGYNLTTRPNLCESLIKHLDMDSLLKELKKNRSAFYPYVEASYMSHLMRKEKNNETHYFRLKELLYEHDSLYSRSEKYIFFSMLCAFGNQMFAQRREKKYSREVLDIYMKMIDSGNYKFSNDDFFQLGLFRSMLIQARHCGEYEWMKHLIDNYINELHPNHRDNMKLYSLGQYYFGTGEYGKALESLITLKSDYFLDKKDLKNLLFRIYYSLGYYEEAFSVLDSLRHYLSSTGDLSEKINITSRNFVKFASELLRLKTGSEKSKNNKQYLAKKIRETKNVESADWLLAKIEEMK